MMRRLQVIGPASTAATMAACWWYSTVIKVLLSRYLGLLKGQYCDISHYCSALLLIVHSQVYLLTWLKHPIFFLGIAELWQQRGADNLPLQQIKP